MARRDRSPADPADRADPADPTADLTKEGRDRRLGIPAAILAGLLPLAAALVVVGSLQGPSNRLSGRVYVSEQAEFLILIGLLQLVGGIATAIALVVLFDAIKARRPQTSMGYRHAAIVSGVVAALVGTGIFASTSAPGLLAAILAVESANEFVETGSQTYDEYLEQSSSGITAALLILQVVGTFAVVLAFVGIAINAMRTGLMNRIYAYVGVMAGVLAILPLFGGTLPVVQSFWLIALALLFAGRWPGGQPAAWNSGRSEPFPSLQEMRERNAAAKTAGLPEPEPPADPRDEEAAEGGAVAAGAARRKRKKRR